MGAEVDGMVVQVIAEGHPVPQGTLVRSPHGGLYYPRALKLWREQVAAQARIEMRGLPLIRSRCHANLRFYVTDAVKGVVIEDDELVVGFSARKDAVEPGHVERVDFSFNIVEA